MGCAGDCPGCGEPGFSQVHATVVGDDVEAAYKVRGVGKYETRLIQIDNLYRYPERRVRESIITVSGKGSFVDAQGWLMAVRSDVSHLLSAQNYAIKIVREKIELAPGHPDIEDRQWLYREAHASVPFTLDAYQTAKEMAIPVSINAGKAVGIRPLILTLRQYGVNPRWAARVAEMEAVFKPIAIRHEFTVSDTDPAYDRLWAEEKPSNGQ
jgi:hypothetical protein